MRPVRPLKLGPALAILMGIICPALALDLRPPASSYLSCALCGEVRSMPIADGEDERHRSHYLANRKNKDSPEISPSEPAQLRRQLERSQTKHQSPQLSPRPT
jgi:hypothetical protein